MDAVETKIFNYNYDEFLEKLKSFHGSTGPGLIIGGFMIDLACQSLPVEEIAGAVCETHKCLPDAIQLLTPCTIGNGKLKLIDSGRFALTLCDKNQSKGVRVFVDAPKLENWQEIKKWFFNLIPKKDQNFRLLLQQIKEAGANICSLQHVTVDISFKKVYLTEYTICPQCREAYRASDGKMCPNCQGQKSYYSPQVLL